MPTDPRPVAARPAFWLVLVAALLAVAVALVTGLIVGSSAGADAASPTAPPRPSPAAVAPAVPVEVAPPPSPLIPADCAGVYSRDWEAEFDFELALNPEWLQQPGAELWGTNDPAALELMRERSSLQCAWVLPEGGGDVGIITNLSTVTAEEESTVVDALAAAGLECYAEEGGTRCIVEESTDAGASGESHFVREGVWIGTRWANLSANGYTLDIVGTIFG